MHAKPILTKAKNGAYTLKLVLPNGRQKALHSLYSPLEEAKILVKGFTASSEDLIIILGCGLGYHVSELMCRYPKSKYIIVENIPEIVDLAKEHGQLSDAEGRVKIVTANTPDEAIAEITRYQLECKMPPIKLFALPAAPAAFPDFYKPIMEKLTISSSGKLTNKLKYPRFTNRKLKVLLLDFSYFLSKEVRRGIKRAGHKVLRVEGSKTESPAAVIRRLTENILTFKPDFILTINHLGFDEEGILTSFLESIEMPVASWFVDSPNLIVREFRKNVSPYISIFVWDRTYEKDMRSVGFESVTYLPLATDEKTFKPVHLKHKDIMTYRARVGFVGNSMVTPTADKVKKVPEGYENTIEKLSRIIKSERIPYVSALRRLSEEEQNEIRGLSREERIAIEGATLWKATQEYRLACLEIVSKFKPVIHGDDGWRSILNGNCELRRPLHYYKELPLFYNACDINLNATSLQMIEGVNQRVFDVPACGAFIITDHQKSIESLFEVGKEVITFKSEKELPELLDFYLRHPETRKAVSKKARRRVLNEHTYKERIKTIVDFMSQNYR